MNNSVQPLSEVSSAVEISNHLTLAETHAYFAQQSKNNFETDLFSNVQGTPLADIEMKAVEGDGWLSNLCFFTAIANFVVAPAYPLFAVPGTAMAVTGIIAAQAGY